MCNLQVSCSTICIRFIRFKDDVTSQIYMTFSVMAFKLRSIFYQMFKFFTHRRKFFKSYSRSSTFKTWFLYFLKSKIFPLSMFFVLYCSCSLYVYKAGINNNTIKKMKSINGKLSKKTNQKWASLIVQ